MDFSSCPCSGVNLARYLYPAILATLLDGPRHGYSILKSVSGSRFFSQNPPDPTGLYRTLNKMESEGLLQTSREVEKTQKKVYSLTERGRHCLGEWIETLTAHQAYLADFTDFLRAQTRQAATE
ncbi:MAG: PadR family transcriptional regulator [Desulfomonilia bacterium]|jgi:DNA-binding PadR family transcriptional regulator